MFKDNYLGLSWHPEKEEIYYILKERSGFSLMRGAPFKAPLRMGQRPSSFFIAPKSLLYIDAIDEKKQHLTLEQNGIKKILLKSGSRLHSPFLRGDKAYVLKEGATSALYEIDLVTFKSQILWQDDKLSLQDLQVSSCGRWLSVQVFEKKSPLWHESQILLLEKKSSNNLSFFYGKKEYVHYHPRFSQDGDCLFYLEEGKECSVLHRVCLKTRFKERWPLLEGFGYSENPQKSIFAVIDSDLIVIVSQKWGRSRLILWDLKGDTRKTLPHPCSHIEAIDYHKSTGKIVSLGASYHIEPQLFYQDLRAPARPFLETKKALKSGGDRDWHFTFEGKKGEVHGFFYPPNGGVEKPPLVVLLHSKITGQVCETWPEKAHKLHKMGIAVFYMNYRGSIGYGPSYRRSADGLFGLLEGEDVVLGVKKLRALQKVGDKVVIWGGGLGGYAAISALWRQKGFFQGAIGVFPPLGGEYDLTCGVLDKLKKEHMVSKVALFLSEGICAEKKAALSSLQKTLSKDHFFLHFFKGKENRFLTDECFYDYEKKVFQFLKECFQT